MMKVVFAGTPDFAVPALRALVEMPSVSVQAVYTQPDRPKGRGQRLQSSPVKTYAESQGLPVYQPSKLNTTETRDQLQAYAPDIMIVVAYGQLLPAEILAIPVSGCVNIHASLLPRWRGAAPIHRAIEAGDAETGVCLMQMDVGLDTGAVYACDNIAIENDATTPELHDKLAIMGADLLRKHLSAIVCDALAATPQADSGITYAHKLQKSEARINWHRSATAIARQIRALQPWPGAQTQWDGQLIKLWDVIPFSASPGNDHDGSVSSVSPGTILSSDASGIMVQCGEGCLNILALQPAGKSRMLAAAYANSRDLVGAKFG